MSEDTGPKGRRLPSLPDLFRIYRASGSRRLWDHLKEVTAFDLRRGTDTDVWVPLSAYPDLPNLAFAGRYQPAYTGELRRVLAQLQRNWDPALTKRPFIDLGSGKGKCLIVAAEFGFRDLTGIEFNADLADVARTNLDHCGLLARIACQDVTAYRPWPDGAVVYANNPFDAPILDQVANALEARRDILVIYTNPKHADRLANWRLVAATHGRHSSWHTQVYYWSGVRWLDAATTSSDRKQPDA